MAEQLDIYYGKNRDIFADMGGYIVIIYGETTEIEKERIILYIFIQRPLGKRQK